MKIKNKNILSLLIAGAIITNILSPSVFASMNSDDNMVSISSEESIIYSQPSEESIIYSQPSEESIIYSQPSEARSMYRAAAKPGKWKNIQTWTRSKKLSSNTKLELTVEWLLFAVGAKSGPLGAIISGSILTTKTAREIIKQKYDPRKYGGVYVKVTYRKRATNIKNSKTNVPVPHEFQYVKTFYSSSKFDKVVYTEYTNDGIRLSNN